MSFLLVLSFFFHILIGSIVITVFIKYFYDLLRSITIRIIKTEMHKIS